MELQNKTLWAIFLWIFIGSAFADINDTDIANMPDKGDLSGFSLPPTQMMGQQPLPLQSTGDYPVGMQPAQDIQPPGQVASVDSALPPLNVHLNLSFVNTMDDQVVLEYQYFYTDVRRMPWKGQVMFTNNNNDQSVQIPRSSAVSQILLFLRPSGSGSTECVPVNGQSPVVFNDMTQVQLIGTTDANGNYLCQLVYG